MTQYIDKTTLVAEIERMKEFYENIQKLKPVYESNIENLNELLSFLNTLEVKEVKEVDLEAAIKDYFDNQPIVTRSKGVNYKLIPSGEDIAKHFFELGLKMQK